MCGIFQGQTFRPVQRSDRSKDPSLHYSWVSVAAPDTHTVTEHASMRKETMADSVAQLTFGITPSSCGIITL